jgi:hypothetical protein
MKIINQQGSPISRYINFASCGASKPDEVLQERLLRAIQSIIRIFIEI